MTSQAHRQVLRWRGFGIQNICSEWLIVEGAGWNGAFELLRNIPRSMRFMPNMSTQDLSSNGSEPPMTRASLHSIADKQVLYLTTIGRKTGLPRQIEIWFVVCHERFYLLAERGEAAGWVKNIRRSPNVTVRIGEWQIEATARVLDRQTDRKQWDLVAAMADHKYGWGEGLPVEITPLP
jgi:deazaflavin-dependent oxidoreductase (nitroreductase family)